MLHIINIKIYWNAKNCWYWIWNADIIKSNIAGPKICTYFKSSQYDVFQVHFERSIPILGRLYITGAPKTSYHKIKNRFYKSDILFLEKKKSPPSSPLIIQGSNKIWSKYRRRSKRTNPTLSTCRVYRQMTTLYTKYTKKPLAETQKLPSLKITFRKTPCLGYGRTGPSFFILEDNSKF